MKFLLFLLLFTITTTSFSNQQSYIILENVLDGEVIDFMENKFDVKEDEIISIDTKESLHFIPVKYNVLFYMFKVLIPDEKERWLRETSYEYGLKTVSEVTYLKGDQKCRVKLRSKLVSAMIEDGFTSTIKQNYKPYCRNF